MELFQAEAELNLILESVNFSKKDFLLDKTLSDEKTHKINELINIRTEKRIPIQYLLGYGYFMGEKFYVDPSVLIPRPETELLVQKVAELNGKTILDIGTGSGCIAIMLKKLSDKTVTAIDISEKALETAQKNAKNLSADVNFIHSDLFSNIEQKFDIIVSNPPYIPKSTMPEMQQEIKEHEPHLALFTKDAEGVEFYKKIIEQSQKHLKENGYLAFEIGIGQHKIISQILEQNDFKDIKIIKDFAQIERIVIAKK